MTGGVGEREDSGGGNIAERGGMEEGGRGGRRGSRRGNGGVRGGMEQEGKETERKDNGRRHIGVRGIIQQREGK